MANKTINGCVDWTTGVIKFIGEECDGGDYTGCIEWTGAHAGQVKVVIDDEKCDDTYYGCVDWTTGQFKLLIPDDCCYEITYSEDDCEYCDENMTPEFITVIISGVSYCDEYDCDWYEPGRYITTNRSDVYNGTHILEQKAVDPCVWRKDFSQYIYIKNYNRSDCRESSLYDEGWLSRYLEVVKVDDTHITIDGSWIFKATNEEIASGCVSGGPYSNEQTCPVGTPNMGGESGTAIVIEGV